MCGERERLRFLGLSLVVDGADSFPCFVGPVAPLLVKTLAADLLLQAPKADLAVLAASVCAWES